MKRIHTILLAGLFAAASFSATAIAQGYGKAGGCDGMGPMSGQGGPMAQRSNMKFDPAQRAERHLAMLKYQLKINDAQEPLWQAYEQQLKAEAGKGFTAMKQQAGDEKLTAPERMAKMQSLMEERLVAMKGVHESFNRLYTALTPEQKTVADQHAAQMGRGMKGGRGQGGAGRMMPQG